VTNDDICRLWGHIDGVIHHPTPNTAEPNYRSLHLSHNKQSRNAGRPAVGAHICDNPFAALERTKPAASCINCAAEAALISEVSIRGLVSVADSVLPWHPGSIARPSQSSLILEKLLKFSGRVQQTRCFKNRPGSFFDSISLLPGSTKKDKPI